MTAWWCLTKKPEEKTKETYLKCLKTSISIRLWWSFNPRDSLSLVFAELSFLRIKVSSVLTRVVGFIFHHFQHFCAPDLKFFSSAFMWTAHKSKKISYKPLNKISKFTSIFEPKARNFWELCSLEPNRGFAFDPLASSKGSRPLVYFDKPLLTPISEACITP